MARQRSHSVEFKRQVAQEFLAGESISLLGGAAAAWPFAMRAQQPSKMPTIGYLGPATSAVDSQRVGALVQRLRELGWIEGRTIAIEYRWGEGRSERFTELAAEFVRLKVKLSWSITKTPPGALPSVSPSAAT